MSYKKLVVKVKDRVESLLRSDLKSRDSDERLISLFYWNQLRDLGYEVREMSALDLLKVQSKNKLSSTESIRRTRQMLQKAKPDLRGAKYNERLRNADITRKDMAHG